MSPGIHEEIPFQFTHHDNSSGLYLPWHVLFRSDFKPRPGWWAGLLLKHSQLSVQPIKQDCKRCKRERNLEESDQASGVRLIQNHENPTKYENIQLKSDSISISSQMRIQEVFIANKLEIFEDALFESGKTSTHRTGITCTLINLNTENGERKKLNWAIFEQLPISYPPLGKSSHISLSLLLFTFTQIHQPPSSIH